MIDLPDKNNIGKVQIVSDVIATIAGTAVKEVEGVAGLAGNFSGELAGNKNSRQVAKGIQLQVVGSSVQLTLGVYIKSDVQVQEVAKEVQEKVKAAVETMTGLNATVINVHVVGLVA